MPPPRLDLALRVGQRQEPVRVEAFVAKTAIERLHKGVVGRLAGPAEIKRHAIMVSPAVERLGDELWPIVDPDRLSITSEFTGCYRGCAAHQRQPPHRRNDLLASDALVNFDG